MAKTPKEVLDVKDPGFDIVPVATPSDTINLKYNFGNGSVDAPARALLIAVGGVIKITTLMGEDRLLTVPAGYLLCHVRRVWATGLTATGISAIY